MFGQLFVAFFVTEPPHLVVSGSLNKQVCPIVVPEENEDASPPRPVLVVLLVKGGGLAVAVPCPIAYKPGVGGLPKLYRPQPQRSIGHLLQEGAVLTTGVGSVQDKEEGISGAVIPASTQRPLVYFPQG